MLNIQTLIIIIKFFDKIEFNFFFVYLQGFKVFFISLKHDLHCKLL